MKNENRKRERRTDMSDKSQSRQNIYQAIKTNDTIDDLRKELASAKSAIRCKDRSYEIAVQEIRDLRAELAREKRECAEGWRRWKVLLESTK